MKNAIEIKNLNKTYKAAGKSPEKVALKNINLDIPCAAQSFGLLGPNGAGKSTIINIMAGLVVKTSGQINIWDLDIDKNRAMQKHLLVLCRKKLILIPSLRLNSF